MVPFVVLAACSLTTLNPNTNAAPSHRGTQPWKHYPGHQQRGPVHHEMARYPGPPHRQHRHHSSKEQQMNPWMETTGDFIEVGDITIRERVWRAMQGQGVRPMNGYWDRKMLWPRGEIPFVIGPDFTSAESGMIIQGMDALESKSCVRFRKFRGDPAVDYHILIQKNYVGKCSSLFGRESPTPPVVVVNLGVNEEMDTSCLRYPGFVAHELMHAVGFLHEAQRPDRDDYIDLHTEDMIPGTEGNYLRADESLTFELPFDFNSIMMYPKNMFSDPDKGYPTPTSGFQRRRKVKMLSHCKM